MKFFITSLLPCIGLAVYAQPSITPLTFESYTFPDKFDTEYGNGEVKDGFQWGGGLELGLGEKMAVELIYQNLKTDILDQRDQKQAFRPIQRFINLTCVEV